MFIKRCVRYAGKLYCFNKGDENVTVYREQTYRLDECPKNVIAAFIKQEYDINIEIVDEKLLAQEEIEMLLKLVRNTGD